MGVGKGFWDVLKPVAQMQSLDSLRGKVLAIDLSFWMIQLLSSVNGIHLRKPHIRLLFFRTIHLVAKIGAYPVFVADGEPPPLKLQVRLQRFNRLSGIHLNIPIGGTDNNIARNNYFMEHIDECVELLKLLGLPVLTAKHEAEGLCAELERQGLVHACVTPDSDSFLYGARHVIKILQADPKDPHVESYMMNDIESSLGLHREHLVALALLAGCDYNVHGVSGIGCSNALRLIKNIPRQQVFDRLRDWGKQKMGSETHLDSSNCDVMNCLNLQSRKNNHCSCCGHPGTKRLHNQFGCEYCRLHNGLSDSIDTMGCNPKGQGFKCTCQYCQQKKLIKEDSKRKHWQLKIIQKIAATENFPNEEIIQIFMNPENDVLECDSVKRSFTWNHPKLEALERFLEEQLNWKSTYIRQKVLPLLSFYCLKEKAAARKSAASDSINPTINGLYAPYLIQRIKISFSKPLYRLQWRQVANLDHGDDWLGLACLSSLKEKKKYDHLDALISDFKSEKIDSSFIFSTDEDMMLVEEACPEIVSEFEKEQEARKNLKRNSSRRKKILDSSFKQQCRITSFFKQRKELASNANITNLKKSYWILDNACINNEGDSSERDVSEDQGQGASSIKHLTVKKQDNVSAKPSEFNIPSIDIKDEDCYLEDECEPEINLLPERNGSWNVLDSIKQSKMSDTIYVEDVEIDEALYPSKACKFGENSPGQQAWKSFSCSSKGLEECMQNTFHTPQATCIGDDIQNDDNHKVSSKVSENTRRFHVCRALF